MGPPSKKKKAAGGAAKGMSSLLDKWAAVRKQVVSKAVDTEHSNILPEAFVLCTVQQTEFVLLAGQGFSLLLTVASFVGS